MTVDMMTFLLNRYRGKSKPTYQSLCPLSLKHRSGAVREGQRVDRMLFVAEKGSDVKPGRFNRVSSASIGRYNRFLREYHPGLFIKFNPVTGLLEIWDTGPHGKQYIVKELKTPEGHFREPDYRDLNDIDSRSYERIGCKDIASELERSDAMYESWHDNKVRMESFDISIENFNRIMKNPVIGGRR